MRGRIWRPHGRQLCRMECALPNVRLHHAKSSGINLPDPPYALPVSTRFYAERSGTFSKKWLLEQLPACKQTVRDGVYLPNKRDFWELPMHESLKEIAEHLPYHDVLRYIMEHNYFFLFDTLLKAADAPLPHILYDDFMKCRTFASLQNPPEEQFALPSTLLRTLLCMAAYQCILDPHYFTTCQLLFRRMEQQQVITSEVLSAWVYCCAASGKVEEAMAHAKHMAEHNVPFDERVFSLMQHPSIDPVADRHRAVWHSAKGILLQRRLSGRLHGAYSSDSVAAHGMFVFYALTLNHVKKWEVVRVAAALGVSLSERTLSLVVDVYAREKGLRCGPKTIKALAFFLAREGTAAHFLFVLFRAKKNELLQGCGSVPRTVFGEAEKKHMLQIVERRARCENRFSAVPLLFSALLREEEDPRRFFDTLASALNASRTSDGAADDHNKYGGDGDRDEEGSLIYERGVEPRAVPVCALLRELDALEKASRNVSSRREAFRTSQGPGEDAETAAQKELQKLQDSGKVKTGMIELARSRLAEKALRRNMELRLHAAWVNPDRTL